MYLNELNIEYYKILENINITFRIPRDGKNSLNILAGPNGTGKTTLLELIFNNFSGNYKEKGNFSFRYLDDEVAVGDSFGLSSGISNFPKLYKIENEYKNGIHSSPRIIYLPNRVNLEYEAASRLNTDYYFINFIDPQHVLGNAELYIKEFVINRERKSTKSDPEERAKDAIAEFNALFEDTDFVTKLSNLDPHDNNRPIFETVTRKQVYIGQLSDGEKQLYGRVVALLLLNPHNSLILIDEPEIGLHPKWQYSIIDIYKKIGRNNQFIIATHSPYIIAKAHFKELILLKKENNGIISEQFDRPPAARDINSVLGGIMDAKFLPDEVTERHRHYRSLVEEGKKESPEAKALRDEILEHEPEESEFMQSIRFYEELNG